MVPPEAAHQLAPWMLPHKRTQGRPEHTASSGAAELPGITWSEDNSQLLLCEQVLWIQRRHSMMAGANTRWSEKITGTERPSHPPLWQRVETRKRGKDRPKSVGSLARPGLSAHSVLPPAGDRAGGALEGEGLATCKRKLRETTRLWLCWSSPTISHLEAA